MKAEGEVPLNHIRPRLEHPPTATSATLRAHGVAAKAGDDRSDTLVVSILIPGAPTIVNPRETFHIEILGPDEDESGQDRVRQRVSVRASGAESAKEWALTLFARARAPQRSGGPAQAVRIIDGAGTEIFHRSRFDESA